MIPIQLPTGLVTFVAMLEAAACSLPWQQKSQMRQHLEEMGHYKNKITALGLGPYPYSLWQNSDNFTTPKDDCDDHNCYTFAAHR